MGWKFYRIWSTDWFRNRSVEQSRLLETATDTIKRPAQVLVKLEKAPSAETFEEVMEKKPFEFSPYKATDIQSLYASNICRAISKGW